MQVWFERQAGITEEVRSCRQDRGRTLMAGAEISWDPDPKTLWSWTTANSTSVSGWANSTRIAQSPLSPLTVNSNSCRTVSQHLSNRSSGWKLASRVIVGVESSTWSKLEVNSRGKVRRTMSRFMCLYRTMPTVRSLESVSLHSAHIGHMIVDDQVGQELTSVGERGICSVCAGKERVHLEDQTARGRT